MAVLDCHIDVEFDPPQPVAGQWAQITVRVGRASADIAVVHAAVADYDFSVVLRKSADNVFSARVFVPWEADAGRYNIIVWAVTSDGVSGPRITVPVSVKSA